MVDKGRWVTGDREGQRARVSLRHRVDLDDTGAVSHVTGVVVGWWRESATGDPLAIIVDEHEQVVIPWSNVAAISDPAEDRPF